MELKAARRRTVWAAGFVLLVLAALALGRTPFIGVLAKLAPQFSAVPRIGARVIDFTLPAANGQVISTGQFTGSILVINFWATWCPPCREEMPALQQVYDMHRNHGLVLIGVNFGEAEEPVTRYAREIGVSFPLALDQNMAVARRYQVQGLPTTIFVDRKGVIRDLIMGGPMSLSYIEDKVQPLLDDK